MGTEFFAGYVFKPEKPGALSFFCEIGNKIEPQSATPQGLNFNPTSLIGTLGYFFTEWLPKKLFGQIGMDNPQVQKNEPNKFGQQLAYFNDSVVDNHAQETQLAPLRRWVRLETPL